MNSIRTYITRLSARLGVGALAIMLVVGPIAPTARAATASELQAQIATLLAQIQSLQAQISGGMPGGTCTTYTRDLAMGAMGTDVTSLQQFLIGNGHSIAAGATGYFGAQTKAALATYQATQGISPAAGYFGPITRAKVNMMCVSTPSDDHVNDDEDSGSAASGLRGEASLHNTDLKDGDETVLEEGQDNAAVAEFEVEFTDGDAKITRLDISFEATGEQDPWKTFDEVSLIIDGDEVAQMKVDDKDDWRDDEKSLRFGGLAIVAEEDEPLTIVIAVSVQNAVKNLPADWEVDVSALRFIDGDGASETESISVDPVDFTIEEGGAQDELVVRVSGEDPDATTLQVKENKKSGWQGIFAFDLDTDDSINDIELKTLVMNVATNDAGGTDDVISDARVVIDGDIYDDWQVGAQNALNTTYTFDVDGDHIIDAGDRVTVLFEVQFKQLSGNYTEGTTIQASTSAATIEAEGADDLEGSQLKGAATGDVHTLRTIGAVISVDDVSASLKRNSDTTTDDDEGVFTIEFEVTAFESDLYIDDTAASGTAQGTAGANYLILQNGAEVESGSFVATLDSSADVSNGRYRISEGKTETFTLTVEFGPEVAGAYKLQLYSVNYNSVNDDAAVWQLAVPQSAFDTNSLSI